MFRRRPKEPILPPEWLIVGLGNPGPEYRGTRHNVGFELLDLLAHQHRIKLDRGRHRAQVGQGTIKNVPVALVKPLTYMNLSGQAVAPLAKGFGIKPERILVVADEMDLPVGKLRLRESGSAGGHNGHKSLIQHLHSQDYPRIRIGIGKKDKTETIDHVLGSFEPREREIIDEAVKATAEACETLITEGILQAQLVIDAYNKRNLT